MGGEQAMQYFYDVDSCTIGKDNLDLNGGKGAILGYYASQNSKIANSVILGSWLSKEPHCTIRNCVFVSKPANVLQEHIADCIVTNLDSLAFDSEYHPVIGANVAIDIGDVSIVSDRIDDAKDLLGCQRIMNGRMDAGAVEADWRPLYAKYLGGRRLVVTAVSPEVRATAANQVYIPVGSVDCVLPLADMRNSWFYVDFDVIGTGALNIHVDGVLAGSYSSGRRQVRFSAGSGRVSVRMEYVPGMDDEGGVVIYAVREVVGTVILFR